MYGKTGIPPSISHKYPTNRDIGLKSGISWLEGRRQDEEAEGLWRIYDNLYDLTDFIKKHPGGENWLVWTKGCDITEAYECHHLTSKPDAILPKYFVRKAKSPRNFKFTMHENGFFKTLKRRVGEKLKTLDYSKSNQCKRIIDSLFIITLTLAIISTKTSSFLLAACTGMFLNWTVICAHNFFHQKDNWRMKLWNLSLMSYREWRISHALSHHIYPNTLHDLEISYFEPFLNWIPSPKVKDPGMGRYAQWAISPIAYGLIYYMEFVKRLITATKTKDRVIHLDDIIVPLIVPTVMFLFGNRNVGTVMMLWCCMLICGAFCFGVIGLNAAHHHPDVVHEGDAHNPSLDWGIFTVDTVMEREDLRGNIILTLTNFGDHCLHHLFPTIDHALLPDLHETVIQTCYEFKTDFRSSPWWDLIKGQFEQLVRLETNPVPVSLRKKWD